MAAAAAGVRNGHKGDPKLHSMVLFPVSSPKRNLNAMAFLRVQIGKLLHEAGSRGRGSVPIVELSSLLLRLLCQVEGCWC